MVLVLAAGVLALACASPEARAATSYPQVATGGFHSCAVLSGGGVKCWGFNSAGQLGDGTTTDSSVPVSVQGISNATEVAAGGAYSCAVLSDGAVKCWGFNSKGQLGDGTTTNSSVPVSVQGISNATDVAAGGTHACAVLSGGSVKCWGGNNAGQLGNGTTTDSTVPVTAQGIGTATQVATGDEHTCVVNAGHDVSCWGSNSYGQLGASLPAVSPTPSLSVQNLSDATQVAVGEHFSCALLSGASVKCWGRNQYKQLGDGTTTNSLNPVSVQTISTAAQLATGRWHACVVLADGNVRCWGNSEAGALGDGNVSTLPAAPVSPLGVSGATQIAGGLAQTCVALANGGVKCWGYNYFGALGDGTTTSSNTPVTVQGLGTSPPGAPLSVSATAGDAQVQVTWNAPSSDGGSPITRYTVTASPGGRQCVWSGGPLSCVVTGLTNGTAYTFTVTATSGAGTGPTSGASSAVTPQAPSSNPGPTTPAGTDPGTPTTTPVSPGGSPAPAAAPAVTLAAARRSIKVTGGKAPVSCQALTGAISKCAATLTAKGKRIGSVSGAAGKLVLKLNAAGRKMLKRSGGQISATLTLTAQTPGGPVVQKTKITLTR